MFAPQQLSEYFERIGYTGGEKPSAENLRGLHIGHTMNIPFENLDVVAGLGISLAPQSLFDKLVTRRRGGYCFEMNGLFSSVLCSLGYPVTRLLARGAMNNGEYTAKLHEIMRV
ncbi:MAG: arylamine N-acetyltransferase, partial [Oscillospiraceae bacterium]|nr:arylamine N-acetyltransferase [Oscillospiraceae bacterium]